MLRQIEGRERKGPQRMRCLNGITDSMDMNLSKLQKIVDAQAAGVLQSMASQKSDSTQ